MKHSLMSYRGRGKTHQEVRAARCAVMSANARAREPIDLEGTSCGLFPLIRLAGQSDGPSGDPQRASGQETRLLLMAVLSPDANETEVFTSTGRRPGMTCLSRQRKGQLTPTNLHRLLQLCGSAKEFVLPCKSNNGDYATRIR